MSDATAKPRRPWLLVSDIDDTLTGDCGAMERLGSAIERHRDQLWFAVNSSRPSASVAQTLAEVFPSALRPDAMITALGTEIVLDGKPLPGWEARFDGWPFRQVHATLNGLGHTPHAPQFQTPRKVSFAIPAGADQSAARNAIATAGITCRIIASGIDDFDVIPENAGKDAATLALAAALGCPTSRVIVAGDSGNDLAMFHAADKKIAVANARQELLEGLESGSFYHATQPYSAGVLEGLVHYGVLPRCTIEN